jgi:hypothetical protein
MAVTNTLHKKPPAFLRASLARVTKYESDNVCSKICRKNYTYRLTCELAFTTHTHPSHPHTRTHTHKIYIYYSTYSVRVSNIMKETCTNVPELLCYVPKEYACKVSVFADFAQSIVLAVLTYAIKTEA